MTLNKLWSFKVTNPTDDYTTVRIRRATGGALIVFPVQPGGVDIPWNASHDAPIIFKEKADCVVVRDERVTVELEWGE